MRLHALSDVACRKCGFLASRWTTPTPRPGRMAEKGLEAPVPSYKMETFSHSEGTQPIARPPCTQKGLVPRRVCFPPRSTPGTSSPWIRSPTFLDLFLSVGSGKTGWRQVS